MQASATPRHPALNYLPALLITLVTLLPVGVVLSSLLQPAGDVWQHLLDNLLLELTLNTLWLMLGVGAGSAILGVSLAWLTAACHFPGRRFFSWAMMLPLAMPTYVLAFTLIGLLEFTGPLQTWLRGFGDIGGFPNIRSRGGVILVMSLALYPYVYLLCRNAFLTQGRRLLEVAQSLGYSPRRGFWQLALPMARPWIVGGVSLVLMETLADFGTVATFNYDTFTTGIYKAWYAMFSLPAASQLASLLLLLALGLMLAELRLRRGRQYNAAGRGDPALPLLLTGWRAWLASAWCVLILSTAFLIPLAQLLIWAWQVAATDLDQRYLYFVGHSLLLAGLAALLITAASLVLAYLARNNRHWGMQLLTRLATLGYAVPGAVLAVGAFIPVAWLDNLLIDSLRPWLSNPPTQIIKGTLFAMLVAYMARFLAVGYQPVESALQRITPNQEYAARSLGVSGLSLLRRLHLPMLRGGLLTGLLLVFVDVMKEMPITLMTRPFGWDTLAIRVFEMTSEGEWQRAALPSVALVLVGLLPVILLMRNSEKT
ncbi:MAG: iron(III) transport system permease protein [Pseudomonadota bacterium]|jgi:iron(III) transport system permease protein|nr:iron(III) transport system permease protein [Pseudomonadota bacterium]